MHSRPAHPRAHSIGVAALGLLAMSAWLAAGCLPAEEGSVSSGTADGGTTTTGIGTPDDGGQRGDAVRVGGGMDRGGEAPSDATADDAPRATLHFTQETGDDGGTCAGTERCVIFTAVDGVRTIAVRYAVGDEAIADEVVKFRIEEDHDTIGYSSALSAYTDADGIATAEVGAVLEASGQFVIRVHVDDEEVTPIFFDIVVVEEDFVPLTVVPEFGDLPDVVTWTARLFHQDTYGEPSCADAYSLQGNTSPDLETKPLATSQTARFLWMQNLEADKSQSYTALALAHDAAGATTGWGCLDAGVEAIWGESLTIDLPIEPRPPQIEGTYDATLAFELGAALSEPHRLGLEAAVAFLADPVAELITIACEDNEYADAICAALAPTTEMMDDDDPNPAVGAVITDQIGLIANSMVDAEVWDGLATGALLPTEMLHESRLHATLSIANEPTASTDGTWAGGASKTTITGAAVEWAFVDTCDDDDLEAGDCGWSQALVSGMQSEPATGTFIAALNGLWGLDISPHNVSLQPSALVDALWQVGVLPHLFGLDSGVDSHADLVRALLAGPNCLDEASELSCCTIFADEIHRHPDWPTDDDHAPSTAALVGWCETLVLSAAAELSARIRGPAAEAGESFAITGTSACLLSDDDGDMTVDAMGAAAGCAAGLEVTAGAEVRTVPALLSAVAAD